MDRLQSPKVDGLLGQVVTILQDVTSRTEATLAASTCWGLGYGLALLLTGVRNDSLHFLAMGRYYLVMAVVSGTLALGFRGARKAAPEKARLVELGATLAAGLLLLAANAAVALVVKGLVRGSDGRASTLIQFIVLALYSMILVGMTVRGFALYARGPSLLLSTTKAVSVCKALMSLVFLTVTAAFTFGSADKPVWGIVDIGARSLGIVVSVASMAVAVWSIVRAARGLAALRRKT